jgi:hypothetical protein
MKKIIKKIDYDQYLLSQIIMNVNEVNVLKTMDIEILKDILLEYVSHNPINHVSLIQSLLGLNRDFNQRISNFCVREFDKNEIISNLFSMNDVEQKKKNAILAHKHIIYIRQLSCEYVCRITGEYCGKNHQRCLTHPKVCYVCKNNTGVVDDTFYHDGIYCEYPLYCCDGCVIRCECGFDNVNIQLECEIRDKWRYEEYYKWTYNFDCKMCGKNIIG